ncbi:predicted protein [Culex quinquefasciatus]|uniref:Predicted protein n=1 Tax=Culex quinquefasciatus TaxID=7176 RepID=B0WC80_CULQU|nr:predicted protein [Culex quinquefasciatus]|eukprot:XP_001846314.1 predicted protein [Culex quinquefasciatus]
MARSVLSRMETICAEVMEMPEIFLADGEEDDDDDGSTVEIDEAAELDELAADEDDAESVEDCDGEKSKDASKSGAGKGGKSSKEKGVSVKVNCEDKKQQKVGKWISRALQAAVNPIVTKFNLNLKVNLDLNVANKEGKQEAATNASKQQEAGKPKPTAQQMRRRADLARIKEKQTTLNQKESDLNQLTKQLQTLQEDFAKCEANHLQNSQQHLQKQAQLELKVMDLIQKNRELTASSQEHRFSNSTVREDSCGAGHACPLCGSMFRNMADLQIHVESCVS